MQNTLKADQNKFGVKRNIRFLTNITTENYLLVHEFQMM